MHGYYSYLELESILSISYIWLLLQCTDAVHHHRLMTTHACTKLMYTIRSNWMTISYKQREDNASASGTVHSTNILYYTYTTTPCTLHIHVGDNHMSSAVTTFKLINHQCVMYIVYICLLIHKVCEHNTADQ